MDHADQLLHRTLRVWGDTKSSTSISTASPIRPRWRRPSSTQSIGASWTPSISLISGPSRAMGRRVGRRRPPPASRPARGGGGVHDDPDPPGTVGHQLRGARTHPVAGAALQVPAPHLPRHQPPHTLGSLIASQHLPPADSGQRRSPPAPARQAQDGFRRDLEAADFRTSWVWEPSAGTAGCPLGPALRATPGPTSYAQEIPL